MFIGLVVHKATLSMSLVAGERGVEVRHCGTIPNLPEAIRKLVEELGDGGRHHFCYEAGPCGYGLHEQLTGLGRECVGVSPSGTSKNCRDDAAIVG